MDYKNFLLHVAQISIPNIFVTTLIRYFLNTLRLMYRLKSVDTTLKISSVAMFIVVSACSVFVHNMWVHVSCSIFVPDITCLIARHVTKANENFCTAVLLFTLHNTENAHIWFQDLRPYMFWGRRERWLFSRSHLRRRIVRSVITNQNKLHGLTPRVNYTGRATAACRRS
jgi:hypothetical protein